MTDADSPVAGPGSMRVYFHESNLDHETELQSAFVRSLPSVELDLTRDMTVEQVVSRAMDLHVQAGHRQWAGRQAETVVLFGGMGTSGDDYYPLGWHLFGVDAEGHLVVYDTIREAILGDLLRALGEGYFGLAPADDPLLVVTLGAGWGGNGVFVADMVRWLGDVAPEIILAYLATKSLDHLPDAKKAKLRSLADKWARRKIDSPFVLREWIQTKDSWQVAEVSKRLELNEEASRELLLSLGYEDVGLGVLALKSSLGALTRRDAWIWQETSRFEEAIEELVEPERTPPKWWTWLRGRRRHSRNT